MKPSHPWPVLVPCWVSGGATRPLEAPFNQAACDSMVSGLAQKVNVIYI